MLINSLCEEKQDFNSLEKIIFRFVCKLGCMLLKMVLMRIDNDLMNKRDKNLYRHKGKKETTIKTVMGEVKFKRTIYKINDESAEEKFKYLLDEYLGLEIIGLMSANLVEKIVENSCEVSYRKAAENVSETTGCSISHTAAWNIVQELGTKIEQEEKRKIKRFRSGKLSGKKEVKVLFEEADGLWLSMQRKDRPKNDSNGKREIKLSVTYEGWVKKSGKKERFEVVNKRVVAGFMKSESFKELRDANIAEEYNFDEIDTRIINGDGASWIKNGTDAEGVYFQLDPFHLSQAVVKKVYDKYEAKNILRMLRDKEIPKALKRIEQLKYECGGEADKVINLQDLEGYLMDNIDGLISYKNRDTLIIPDPSEGMCYRNMGIMEHDVYDVLGYRMKGRKMSWSISGANNLSKILATKASKKLKQTIKSLLSSVMPERFSEEVVSEIKKVKSKVRKHMKDFSIHKASIPYSGCANTPWRKVIRQLFSDRAASELILR